MSITVTHDGLVEVSVDATFEPFEARTLALELMKATDLAFAQDARNFTFRTKQRNPQ